MRALLQNLCLLAAAAGVLATAGKVHARCKLVCDVRIASHRLGYSGAAVTVVEDYRRRTYPAAHRTFVLRVADGRIVSLSLPDGGARELSALALYKGGSGADAEMLDPYLLIGARTCVLFDAVAAKARVCKLPQDCGSRVGAGSRYLGQYDWANGFDPPSGRFQFTWRFLPFEDAAEPSFCPAPLA